MKDYLSQPHNLDGEGDNLADRFDQAAAQAAAATSPPQCQVHVMT